MRFDHPVALVLQRLHHQHTDKTLVLYHQDGFALVGGGRLRQRGPGIRRLRGAVVAGKVQLDGRAVPFFRIDRDMAAGLAGETIELAEAQAGSWPIGLVV